MSGNFGEGGNLDWRSGEEGQEVPVDNVVPMEEQQRDDHDAAADEAYGTDAEMADPSAVEGGTMDFDEELVVRTSPVDVDEVVEWVRAPEVEAAVQAFPEGPDIYQRVVEDRKALIRTAAGVALLDEYERAVDDERFAKQRQEVAKTALGRLGVSVEEGSEAGEEPDDVYLTEQDFLDVDAEKYRWQDDPHAHLGRRAYNALLRQAKAAREAQQKIDNPDATDGEKASAAAYADLAYKDLIRPDGSVSTRLLKELYAAGKFDSGNTRNVGIMTKKFLGELLGLTPGNDTTPK